MHLEYFDSHRACGFLDTILPLTVATMDRGRRTRDGGVARETAHPRTRHDGPSERSKAFLLQQPLTVFGSRTSLRPGGGENSSGWRSHQGFRVCSIVKETGWRCGLSSQDSVVKLLAWYL